MGNSHVFLKEIVFGSVKKNLQEKESNCYRNVNMQTKKIKPLRFTFLIKKIRNFPREQSCSKSKNSYTGVQTEV